MIFIFPHVCAKYDTCCSPVVLCCKWTRAIESWPRMEFPIIIHIRTRNYEMRNGKLILQFTFEMFTSQAGLCAETRAVWISIISNKENTNIITNWYCNRHNIYFLDIHPLFVYFHFRMTTAMIYKYLCML